VAHVIHPANSDAVLRLIRTRYSDVQVGTRSAFFAMTWWRDSVSVEASADAMGY
jgi:hypothetical protein